MIKKFIIILIAFASISYADAKKEINKMIEELVTDYKAKAGDIMFKKRIAVFNLKELSPDLKKYETGKSISAIITTKLGESLIFTLIEREEIEKALKEIELGMTGMIDEKTAPQAGNLLGAELLLDGTVSEIGDTVNVDVKLIKSETGEIILTKNTTLKKEEVINEAKSYYFSSFQSKYGINLSVEGMAILLKKYNSALQGYSLNAGYKLSKNFNVGVGYLYIGGNELIREENLLFTNGGITDNIYRNYNYSATGGFIYFQAITTPTRWLNLGLKSDFALLEPKLEQDVQGISIYTPTSTNNTLLKNRRILVESWFNANPSFLINLLGTIDILISKRVSINLKCGWTFATKFLPTVYEANGRRQWTNAEGNKEEMDEADAEVNGTFSEFRNFNFSRFGINGDRVKIDISGIALSFGLSIHF